MTSWWRRRPLHLTDEDLSGYLDNDSSAREADRIREHIDGCEDCRARLDGLRAVQSMLAELPRVIAPRSFVLSREQAGAQTTNRLPAGVVPPPSRFRIPSFAPAVALTFFLAVLAVDLAGSGVSQQEDSTAGAPMSAPARSAYNDTDDAAKSSDTQLSVPQAAGAVAPPSTQSSAESAAGSTNPAAAAPVAPSVTNSAAGAAPDASAAGPTPATGGLGGATSPASAPGAIPAPRTGESLPAGTPLPSTAQASIPSGPPAPADTFGSSADLSSANTDAASQIGVEPAQGGDATGRQSGARDDSGGLDGITLLEIALFVLFLGSLAAVVWPRLFNKGVR